MMFYKKILFITLVLCLYVYCVINHQYKRKKVLFCLFGVIPRSISTTFPKIEENIINVLEKEYDVDVYGFNLKVDNDKMDGVTLNNDDVNVVQYDFFEEREQSKLDKEINEFCKSIDCTCGWYPKGDKIHRNCIRQMYSEYRVGLFVEKNSRDYDCVVVCGPDFYIANPINLEDVYVSINEDVVFTSQMNDARGYTNGFYFGKPRLIIPLLKRYENLKYNLPVPSGDYEYLFKKSFDDSSIKREKTDIVFFKVRANNDVFWKGIDEYQDFLSLEQQTLVIEEHSALSSIISSRAGT